MKKQLLVEINRLKEIMGLKPQLLTEGFGRVFIEFMEAYYKKNIKNAYKRDNPIAYILKSQNPEVSFQKILKGEAAGDKTAKGALDLSDEFTEVLWEKGDTYDIAGKKIIPTHLVGKVKHSSFDVFMRGLDTPPMTPNEAEVLLRMVKHGRRVDEMVGGMIKSPDLRRHFKELFPSGKVGQDGLEILAAELNTDVTDELVKVLARMLNKDLPKVMINTPAVKIPFITKWKIPAGTHKIKIPRIVYAFNRKNLAAVLSSRKFWKTTGMWMFGVPIASEISKGVQKWRGWGVYGASASKVAFNPKYYLDKRDYYEDINDYDWIKRNELNPNKVATIIQDLKTAGVGAYADFDTDDDAIVNIYQNDIKTVFQAAQIAWEWNQVEDGDLEEDILTSMNFPIQIVSSEWLAAAASAGINAILPDWVGEVDWTDDNIRKVYYKVVNYDDYINEKGEGVREGTSYTLGDTEKEKMFRLIMNYPPELEHKGETYCTTRGYKILTVAWAVLTEDQPSWQGAKNYLENMDAEVFNKIHSKATGIHEPVYVLSEDGDCSHIEVGEPSKEDYQKDFDKNFEIIQEILSERKNDG